MPEGDTIHRLARVLRTELVDHELTEVELRERGPLAGLENRRVEWVEARGKHLLIAVESGWTLRTHLGLYGDVHRYHGRERWKRSRNGAVLVVGTDDDTVFAWFEPAQAEVWKTTMLRVHPKLSRLGCDLLSPSVDFDEVVGRAIACARLQGPRHTISELLLDQSVASGIGNIYKCEVLFIEGISPFTSALDLDCDILRRLYERASRLLRQNVRVGPRATRQGIGGGGAFLKGDPKVWVYGRSGRPCLRCGSLVLMKPLGVRKRLTFYCPRCQPMP